MSFVEKEMNQKVLFMSIWGYGRERNGILGNMLNSDPMALKHVMPAMMHFYIGKLALRLFCRDAVLIFFFFLSFRG